MPVELSEVTNTMEDHCLSLQDQVKKELEPQTVNFMTTPMLLVNGDSVVSLNSLFLIINKVSKCCF